MSKEIRAIYRKAGVVSQMPKGKGIHSPAFHSCVANYLKKDMSYSEAAKRCMGALGAKAINPSHRRQESY